MWDQTKILEWLKEQAALLDLHYLGVCDTNLQACEPRLQRWLDAGMHGDMDYMARHGLQRLNPDILLPGTVNIVSFRFNYVPQSALERHPPREFAQQTLETVQRNEFPWISLYARGRDYHKIIRQRLAALAKQINTQFADYNFRVTCDSAPTPEVEIARKAGLGWRGKHTLLINPTEGSLFFLGEIFTNLPLPQSTSFEKNHCGTCQSCMDVCPTQAIVEPYVVDARRCISYLTIETDAPIPVEFRQAIGTRIYGCDDCQLGCPWNKFATPAVHSDFAIKSGFDQPTWLELMSWSEDDFLKRTEGMAMRRIGYKRFRRNLAIAAGNSTQLNQAHQGLMNMRKNADDFLKEHIDWALNHLAQQKNRA